MKSALDDLATSINPTADSPDVRDATKKATSGVAEALASTLHEVAAWLERPPHDHGTEPRETEED